MLELFFNAGLLRKGCTLYRWENICKGQYTH